MLIVSAANATDDSRARATVKSKPRGHGFGRLGMGISASRTLRDLFLRREHTMSLRGADRHYYRSAIRAQPRLREIIWRGALEVAVWCALSARMPRLPVERMRT